jgi:hypothetical protein
MKDGLEKSSKSLRGRAQWESLLPTALDLHAGML